MRKDEGGYVLISVVLVIIVLCISAAGICSSALKSLKVQTAAVEQMQSRCAAESAVERFMAKASVSRDDTFERTGFETAWTAWTGAEAEFESVLGAAAAEMGVSLWDVRWSDSGGAALCRVNASAAAESSRVTAQISFKVQIYVSERVEDESSEDMELKRYDYVISAVTSEYLSYTLDTEGGGA